MVESSAARWVAALVAARAEVRWGTARWVEVGSAAAMEVTAKGADSMAAAVAMQAARQAARLAEALSAAVKLATDQSVAAAYRVKAAGSVEPAKRG